MTAHSTTKTAWAAGGTIFAATMMVVVGVFYILEGITAIIRNGFFFRPAVYPYSLSITGWGWIHLILGVIIVLTGAALYTGAAWARAVGIGIVALAAIDNFFFIPYYPVWAVLLIALDIFIIWALASGSDGIDELG